MSEEAEGLTDNQLEQVTGLLLQKYPSCQAIYLYGSLAKGEGRKDSDADIALLCDSKLDMMALFGDAGAIGRIVKRPVDLVDLRSVNTVLAVQIVANGKRIATVDQFQAELFEAHSLSEYAQLQQWRGEILEDIKQRGSVYG